MQIYLSSYIFILGILLGSFYNVVGLRLPINKSIVKPRSHCTNCNYHLGPLELIPVLSYLFLKGKCRKCKSNISPFYPTIELITGLLFLAAFLLIGLNKEILTSLLIISLLVIITVTDIKYQIIPDKVLVVFLPLLIIARILSPIGEWWEPLVGGLTGFMMLWFIAIVSQGGMGGGDIKLFGLIGIVLGWKLTVLSFFISTLIGFILGMVGIIMRKVERKKPIPFGPSIAAGTLVAYFEGEHIINWYLNLL